VELGGGARPGTGPLAREARRVAAELATDVVASRITDADPSVWGPAADDGLGWAALPRTSRPLVGQIDALREAFRVDGAARVLLIGDARWTLGAEVLAGESGLLRVLDSPDPGAVSHALAADLSGTVLVVADPAGETPWIAVAQELVTAALAEEIGARRAAQRTVVLTEAGSPLDESARAAGSLVITTERDVPAAWSVLGVPGLVPAGLAGVPVGEVLDDARAVAELLTADESANPALALAGVLVTAGAGALRLDLTAGPPALAEWVAALVAAAGGAPVLVEPGDPDGLPAGPTLAPAAARHPDTVRDNMSELSEPDLEDLAAPDEPADLGDMGGMGHMADPDDMAEIAGAVVRTGGPLGAELLLWQYAAAAAARLLDAEAFGPEAPATSSATTPEALPRVGSDGLVDVHAAPSLTASSRAGDPRTALQALVDAVPAGGHLALSAWLDPADDASVAVLRGELARRTGVPVTFGWGPRNRAVLAPFRRDDPRPGALCLITADPPDDLVPDPGPALARLALDEAGSVAADIAARAVPVLRLHLTDRVAGLVSLARAVQGLRPGPPTRGH
jgi:glucose-6-phosphate isomerase